MKFFPQDKIHEARAYAMAGGQALHVCSSSFVGPNAPDCFKRGKEFAHLLDQNLDRLKFTARRLGVRIVFIDREGSDSQHVDLCGAPLERAKKMCGETESQIALQL